MLSKSISSSERCISARDLAFDLGRIKTIDVLKHPDGSSLLFHQRMGKTLRGKLSRAFAVKQTANPAICPVRNLEFFVNLCTATNVDLSAGFLFRPTFKKGGILNAPLLASTVQARLIKYLSSLVINEGESVHGVRAGTSILLRLLAVFKEEVAKHIGWKSTAFVYYYTQVQKVMKTSAVADALACSTTDNCNGSPAEHLGNTFRRCNILSGFTLAFV